MTTAEEILEIFTRARETIKAVDLKPPQMKRLYDKAIEFAAPGTQAVVVGEIVDQVTSDPGDESMRYLIKKHVGHSAFRTVEQAELRELIADLIADVEAQAAAAQVMPADDQVKTGDEKMTEDAGKVTENAEKEAEEADAAEEKPAAPKVLSTEEPTSEKMEESLFVSESEPDSE